MKNEVKGAREIGQEWGTYLVHSWPGGFFEHLYYEAEGQEEAPKTSGSGSKTKINK